MNDLQEIEATSRKILVMLANRRYEKIDSVTGGIRLTGNEIKNIIDSYGVDVTLPPDGGSLDLDIVELYGDSPKRYSVLFNVWTAQEGKSDLSVELSFIFGKEMSVEIDNVHVR